MSKPPIAPKVKQTETPIFRVPSQIGSPIFINSNTQPQLSTLPNIATPVYIHSSTESHQNSPARILRTNTQNQIRSPIFINSHTHSPRPNIAQNIRVSIGTPVFINSSNESQQNSPARILPKLPYTTHITTNSPTYILPRPHLQQNSLRPNIAQNIRAPIGTPVFINSSNESQQNSPARILPKLPYTTHITTNSPTYILPRPHLQQNSLRPNIAQNIRAPIGTPVFINSSNESQQNSPARILPKLPYTTHITTNSPTYILPRPHLQQNSLRPNIAQNIRAPIGTPVFINSSNESQQNSPARILPKLPHTTHITTNSPTYILPRPHLQQNSLRPNIAQNIRAPIGTPVFINSSNESQQISPRPNIAQNNSPVFISPNASFQMPNSPIHSYTSLFQNAHIIHSTNQSEGISQTITNVIRASTRDVSKNLFQTTPQKRCKCGSTTHLNTNHKDCRLRLIANKRSVMPSNLSPIRNNNANESLENDELNRGFIVEKTPFKVGKLYLSAINSDLTTIEYDDIGDMIHECKYCNALHFLDEAVKKSKSLEFSMCCQKGKVVLPDLPECPEFLKGLLSGKDKRSKEFMSNIRSYNNALAFASMSANLDPKMHTSGPYFFKISGQIYHYISNSLHSNKPAYNQLYIYDSKTATDIRMKNSGNRCKPSIMQQLDNMLREINPYYHAFKQLREKEIEQEEIAKITGNAVPVVSLSIKKMTGRYNLPRIGEVAAVFVGQDGNPPFERDITIYPKNNDHLQQLSILSQNTDPMVYPLLFPHGSPGWRIGMKHSKERATAVRDKITLSEFYSHRLSIRVNKFSTLMFAGRLMHQYLVDAYVKMEGNNIKWIRDNQNQLYADNYNGLMDHINTEAAGPVGKVVILPSSFSGSQRNMQQNYQDAMAIVRKYGKPDLFITFTCNPNWPEITRQLRENQTSADVPVIYNRVFDIKLQRLIADIKDNHIFGVPVAHVYVIEFQKRGLPHAHILVILREKDKITVDKIDKIVCAEIPPGGRLRELVIKHMIHGPCGPLNPNCVCMENNKCTKEFPKPLLEHTNPNSNGYPLYRRRNNSYFMNSKNIKIDNSWVVPYNPSLLLKYNAHINVELCSTVKSVKYLYKYVYKGYDCANLQINVAKETANPDGQIVYDEIVQHLNTRYVSAPEAAWRIFKKKMHDQSHTIVRLAIHLPFEQIVYFRQGQERAAAQRAESRNTTLTAFFELNKSDPSARKYLYHEIPNNYTWFDSKWKKRKEYEEHVIGRMYLVSATEGERFYLSINLLHVRGPCSFDDIKKYQGKTYSTFKEVAEARGLLHNDMELKNCITEACTFKMPKQLRFLFSTICIWSNPTNSLELFDDFKYHLIEDFMNSGLSIQSAINKCLFEMEETFKQNGTNCAALGLPSPNINEIVMDRVEIDYDQEILLGEELYLKCNDEQRHVIDTIIDSIDGYVNKKVFFVDSPGGTGKTFVYNALTHKFQGRFKSQCVISVAWTGIASILLIGGSMVHSTFQLPLHVNETTSSNMKLNSLKAKILKDAKLIIWDEGPMAPLHAFNAINGLLKQIMENDELFGGKIFVVGGDFRQIPPVVPHGSVVNVIETSLKSGKIWKWFEILKLMKNMRAGENEKEFADWLIKLGNGDLPIKFGNDIIEIPRQCIVQSLQSLIDELYGSVGSVAERNQICILCPKNENVAQLNEKILNTIIPGDLKTYISVDSLQTDDKNEEMNFPTEFLNSLTPSGMPPHEFNLKIGSVVMLLRNLNRKKGLCNGTRLTVLQMLNHTLECQIISGRKEFIGQKVYLPRITLTTSGHEFPFVLSRKQFPVQLAFCMSINKSQGQTFKKIGLYLPQPVFSHGQLYVAFSRVSKFADIKIKIDDDE